MNVYLKVLSIYFGIELYKRQKKTANYLLFEEEMNDEKTLYDSVKCRKD